MTLPVRLDSRNAQRSVGVLLSVALHGGALLLIMWSGGRYDGIEAGDTPSARLVLIEAPKADRRDGVELPPLEPTALEIDEPQSVESERPAPPAFEDALLGALIAPPEAAPPQPDLAVEAVVEPSTVVLPHAEQAAVSKRLAKLAEELGEKLAEATEAQIAWEQDGKHYSAHLVLERANDGTELDRVIAQVSAADRGKRLTTRLSFKRLAFSQFTQMVDTWDPMVQLHDDEIIGRFHSNSRFNVMADRKVAPKFLGKVSTSARSFDSSSIGRQRDADMFQGGLETRASPIELPEKLQPFFWAPRDAGAQVHEIADDSHLEFFGDGRYQVHSADGGVRFERYGPSERYVYIMANRGVTLHVKGVIAGKVLVYSPHKIVIEDDLTYANDPRESNDSHDYLGLVCDRYVEVASPGATGPGDLEIHAAIFAGRRFVVTNIRHRPPATLRILGSVAAGSLSASEPRYATKIEYDDRFERRRPPGFPSTNRYEMEAWDGQWTETPERTADQAL